MERGTVAEAKDGQQRRKRAEQHGTVVQQRGCRSKRAAMIRRKMTKGTKSTVTGKKKICNSEKGCDRS